MHRYMTHAHVKPVDIKFPQENSRTASTVTDDEIVNTSFYGSKMSIIASMRIQKDGITTHSIVVAQIYHTGVLG